MSVSSLSNAGLRPASAFVVIGAVVLSVAGRVLWLTFGRPGEQPNLGRTEQGELPGYGIEDTRGRTLARFVPRFDLEMSPRSMWQMHTPEYMAQEIGRVLGGEPSADELLASFLPDARDGVIQVDAWELSARQAHAVSAWLQGDEEAGCPPLAGLWVEGVEEDGPGRRTRGWRLAWRPSLVLGEAQREAHGCTSARTWSRHLARGLMTALHGSGSVGTSGAETIPSVQTMERWCADVWSALLPSAWCRPVEGLPADRVDELRRLLAEEGVSPWQMRVAHGRDRSYPAGTHELLGSWGFVGADATEPTPRAGLEALCDGLLTTEAWSTRLDLQAATYSWRTDRTVRGQRAPGYLGSTPASAAPRVVTTIDHELMGFMRRELEGIMREHRPALAMAIVLDVESGDVLAVDSVEAYPVQPFAPVYHLFTTGSTLKVLTMASALEEGVVDEREEIDLGQGAFRVHYTRGPKQGQASGRVIREAEGALRGRVQVRDAFAHSVNSGLAQVGLRMQDSAFRGYLEQLGYGRKAGTGLGSERAGHLPELPWKFAYTHASISFGHEISSTLWQHAAALASVVRGGLHRPLRLMRAVQQGERGWDIEPAEGQRVYREEVAQRVCDLMRFGAEQGTGDDVREALLRSAVAALEPSALEDQDGRPVPVADLPVFVEVGTKTGTAEKVPSEPCVHVEMEARRRWREAGLPATRERLRALRSQPRVHPRCYTSSICIFARRSDARAGEVEPRRLMTLVVVEEPRGAKRFGADVAGPAGARLLAEALRLTVDGRVPQASLRPDFYASAVAERNTAEQPWRLEDRP